jgi:hypothetical protein
VAALTVLVTLARDFTVPLSGNTSNNSLKELLKTAVVSQKHDRVVVTATVGRSFFSAAASENAPPKSY